MRLLTIALLVALTVVGCKQTEEIDPNTEFPQITSLTSDKSEIKIGEATTITCQATGGGLEYEWSVLLGDIIPVNEDASVVSYSGFECCAGEKVIRCNVKNDKGQASDTIVITILE